MACRARLVLPGGHVRGLRGSGSGGSHRSSNEIIYCRFIYLVEDFYTRNPLGLDVYKYHALLDNPTPQAQPQGFQANSYGVQVAIRGDRGWV
jgi:hypothetical protein